eukprot:2382744-Amphidinium_carterae.2
MVQYVYAARATGRRTSSTGIALSGWWLPAGGASRTPRHVHARVLWRVTSFDAELRADDRCTGRGD